MCTKIFLYWIELNRWLGESVVFIFLVTWNQPTETGYDFLYYGADFVDNESLSPSKNRH